MTTPEQNSPATTIGQGKYVIRRLATSPQAQKFIKATTENGGATMDLATSKLYGENGPEEAESVGAEPSVLTKRPIATHIYENQTTLSGEQFAHEYLRLRTHGAPGTAMGSWANGGRLEIDASRVFSDPKEASKAVVGRDQDASFDFRTFDDVPYSEHAKRIGSSKKQDKKQKNEVRIPSDAAPGDAKFRNE